jgi:D-alanyl-D-alanine carboxypeptidase (penicillin-binding protein 5/6)
MGADSTRARATESKELLTWGFNSFDTVQALKSDTALTQARVWYGSNEKVDVGLSKAATIVIPRGRRNDLKANFVLLPTLEAPLAKGQVVGKLFLQLDGKDVAEYPMVSLAEVNEGSVLSRFGDWISKKLAN